MIIPVILAGGTGSRLWPLSREGYPKPFISLIGEHTLFQQTLLRLKQFLPNQLMAPIVVSSEQHQFTLTSQMQAVATEPGALLLEPLGRNTAAVATLAALEAQYQHEDAVLLTMPADHQITDIGQFVEIITRAESLAACGQLITFGVTADHPHTGYGYIKKGLAIVEHPPAYEVSEFIEKPDLAHAQQFIETGNYYWNSGLFMFKASSFLEAIATTAADIFTTTSKAFAHRNQRGGATFFKEKDYQAIPFASIDTAVMEKVAKATVVPFDVGWSDVGSWQALYDLQSGSAHNDANNNITHGNVVTKDVTQCYLRSHDRLLVAIGVKDHVIVETNDAILVAHKDHCQAGLKAVVTALKEGNHTEAVVHKTVYRPWGIFEQIAKGDGFQVKHITVNPGASLSLQLHHQRSEHWVVVAGVAEVTKGDEVFTLKTNQSTYIPTETKHRLRNTGTIPLQIVEVQSGSYLGEDDIVRFEDSYGREALAGVE